MKFRNLSVYLVVYGSSHAVVDATCAAVLLSSLQFDIVDSAGFFSSVVLYDVLAFGLQVPFGLMSDRWRVPLFSAVAGCVLTAVSTIVLGFSSIVAVLFAGIGNALFHVGGGSVSLNLTPKRALAPGVFVAPGAFGLFVGTVMGKSGLFVSWPFVVLLLSLCGVMSAIKVPRMDYDRENQGGQRTSLNHLGLVILLLSLSIAVRSLVGLAIVFPWKSNMILLVILTAVVVLGKALGGILADKLGWIIVATISLLVSAPLLSFGVDIPCVAMLGMFMFNMTMPITLVGISNVLPGRPGFSFGLTCLALIAGALPTFTDFRNIFGNPWLILAVILISAVALLCGLLYMPSRFPVKDSKNYMEGIGVRKRESW